MGSVEDHIEDGIEIHHQKDLSKVFDALSGVGTAANPITIRLFAKTYTASAPLNVPNYCSIIGAGRDATIIQRTQSSVNTAYGTTGAVFCDPVLNMSQSQSVTLENLSVVHSGMTDAGVSSTTSNPCAILTGAAKKFKMSNVRLEGNWSGWYDKTDSMDSTFSKPIVDDVMGNEDYQYRVDNCIVIGHSDTGGKQIARHELYANGCLFMCDIRSTDVLPTSSMPIGFNHWEYLVGYFKSCEFILRSAQTLVVNSVIQAAASFAISDNSITDTIAYCDGCTFTLDLSEGDINSASSGAVSVYIGGNFASGGTIYNYNVFNANNCHLRYGTGTVTSAPYIAGLYIESQSGVNTAVEGRLKNCKFEDFEGSGGTRRRDIVIAGRLANVQAKSLVVENCNVQDYDYRNVSGSPIYTHANFMTEPNTMNYQRGSAVFSPSGTSVSVSLPLAFTASAGITDYFVGLEPSENNTFWVDTKTNSGFNLNAANATAGTIRFVVRR